MITYFRIIILLGLTALATSAMAADGMLSFSGEVVAASCSIRAGAGSTVTGEEGNQRIDVKLGKVSLDSLTSSGSSLPVAGVNINLNLDCGATATGLKTVRLKFDPSSGSGIDPDNVSLLKTTGTAKGVGIGLYDLNNKLLNLSGNETFDAPLVSVGDIDEPQYKASINLRAAFVANGDDMAPGLANATLPFTLTYE